MDIVRTFNKTKKKYKFYNRKTKKHISEKSPLYKHLSSIYIPPAYKRVKFSSKINNKVVAIGQDEAGRSQYTYSKKWKEEQSIIKFVDLIHFGRKLKRIRKDITSTINMCIVNALYNDKECIIALIVYLIDKCNFRVGNDKYRKLYNSYGITTINSSHLKRLANSYKIEFVGKKGVVNKSMVTNKNVNLILDKLCNMHRNKDYLFQYHDKNSGESYRITEKHINDFLKKYHQSISVKMFRTWSANYMLLKELINFPPPQTEIYAKRNVRDAITKAAENMHHTRSVSKKSYMNNEIIDMYLEDFNGFYRLIVGLKKNNGNYPTIDRMLNLILKKLSATRSMN